MMIIFLENILRYFFQKMKFPIKNAKFTQMFPLFAFFLILAIDQASTLNCYICAEGGLDEFGECKASFPFNCDGYGKRFSPQDKIFCRTTRHKTFNGSYTVVKECIAESAHFATFPRKSTQLEEECDVLELNGFEVAYCLCRDADLCNGAPIVEQFTDFEKKYPELFDPIPASNEANAPSSDDADDTSDENEAEKGGEKWPPKSPTEILGGGGKNLATGDDFSPLLQRSQNAQMQQKMHENKMPTWEKLAPTMPNPFAAPPQSTERGEEISRPTGPAFPFGTTDEGIETAGRMEEGQNVESLSPTASIFERQRELAATNNNVGSTGTQLGLLPELQCLQCSENNLAGSDSDCKTQIMLSCPDRSKQSAGIGRPLCITRQIQNGPNYSIEKACTTERAILDEFGGKEAADLLNGAIRDEFACLELPKLNGPMATKKSAGAERLCICSAGQCNRAPIAEQIAYGRMLINQPGPEIHFGPSPPLPSSTQRTISSLNPNANINNNKNMPSANNDENGALNCAICLDVNLRDPKGDCANARAQNCAQLLKNKKAYCLTRQTQNGKDSFIVQKSCVSIHQFYQQFPEELEKHSPKEIQMGCASTYDGFVNYCICDKQMCNRNAIAQQAEAAATKGLSANKLMSTATINSTGIGREGGMTINGGKRGELATATNPFGNNDFDGTLGTTKTNAVKNTATSIHQNGAGGSWEQNDKEDNVLFGTAKVTARRPVPANLSPSTQWSTPMPPTTTNGKMMAQSSTTMPSTLKTTTPTTTSTTTTESMAIRQRLEKWKANSQTTTTNGAVKIFSEKNDGNDLHRRKDIFEEYAAADEANSGQMMVQIGRLFPLFALAIWAILMGRIEQS